MRQLLVLFVIGSLLTGPPWAAMAGAQTPAVDPAAVEQQVIDAINRGDVPAVLAMFADDAVIEGTPDCVRPCVGREGVRREFEAVVAAHVHVTITDVRVSGNSAMSRFEATSDFLLSQGLERIVGSFTIEVRDGKIASSSFLLDASDPETARFLAQYPTLVQPSNPRLPVTGGFAADPAGIDWIALAGVLAGVSLLAFLGGVGGLALTRRRR